MTKKSNEFSRSIVNEQLSTVRNLFVEYGIDLSLISAGRTLYESLRLAKHRTKKRKDYIEKGIKFLFNSEDRLALLEVISGDKVFWEAWINQNNIYDKTGFDNDRPSVHRLNPDGNYEFGNIGVLPLGKHRQEHAVSTAVVILENGSLSAQIFGSKTTTATAIGVGIGKVNNMAKRGYKVVDEATVADTGQVAITMPVKVLEPTNSEDEYKAQCKAHGITYETPEVRAEREKKQVKRVEQQYKEMCETDGIEYLPPEVRRKKADSKSSSEL
ncbi:hypothetical protein [Lysinibacillus sp. NPDC093688]|uniref:hypothetical protein n=1 Tax=Lysinibacillus sp. NPDC093688 TaxID=3390577 RepID=UPI003D06CA68